MFLGTLIIDTDSSTHILYLAFQCQLLYDVISVYADSYWTWTGTDNVEQTSQVAAFVGGIPKTRDDKSVGVNTCVNDLSFNVGKSPQQNGISSFERTSGAGGLGEGTPKV